MGLRQTSKHGVLPFWVLVEDWRRGAVGALVDARVGDVGCVLDKRGHDVGGERAVLARVDDETANGRCLPGDEESAGADAHRTLRTANV